MLVFLVVHSGLMELAAVLTQTMRHTISLS